MSARIDKVVTSGTFSIDGEDHAVDNNIWLVGDDREVVIIDAAHDHRPIVEAVGDRTVTAIVCTHGHNDHINVAVALSESVNAPVVMHPDDTMLWEVVHPNRAVDSSLVDSQQIPAGSSVLRVMHTPGHSPGGCCLYLEADGVVFSGDTLFNGGPGATGKSFSDRPTILRSIAARLMDLPASTVVHTGHGDDTTIGAEAAGVLEALRDET